MTSHQIRNATRFFLGMVVGGLVFCTTLQVKIARRQSIAKAEWAQIEANRLPVCWPYCNK